MRQYLFILGLVGTALFTACSTVDDMASEDPIVTPPDDQTSIAEARQDSDVPITLGVGLSRGYTRAAIGGESDDPTPTPVSFSTETDDPGTPENEARYLGVFCLATDYQESYATNHPIENNWTDDDDTGVIVRMKNVAATVSGGNVSFNDHYYYYPISNWMKYNFYAYYPRQEETVNIDGEDKKTISFSNNQVLEKYYEIDGSQDIIWGIAHPESAVAVASSSAKNAAPYSAKYIRMKKAEEALGEASEDDYLPKLTFKHKLVQFRFFVKAANATARTDLMSKNMQVTDMFINNAIYRLSLVVANKADESKNGLLRMMSTIKTKKLGIKLNAKDFDRFDQNGDGTADNPLPIKNDAVNVALYPETTVTAETAAAYNAHLSGAVSAGSNAPADFETRVGHAPVDQAALTAEEAADYNATLDGAVHAGDENGSVGYILLAPPSVSNDANFKYSLVVKVQYTAGSGIDTNSVAVSLDPPAEGFKEGKIYNIIVNVQSPENITAKAVLDEWVTYDDGEGHNYIEY